MCKYKAFLNSQVRLLGLLFIGSLGFITAAIQQEKIKQGYDVGDGNIFVLVDFESGKIYYKDEVRKTCLTENLDSFWQYGHLIIPTTDFPTTEPENTKNMTSIPLQFCGNFHVYDLSKLVNQRTIPGKGITSQPRLMIPRNKRSSGHWYPGGYGKPGGASQSQVQGQVSGQGYFSGQAQSQQSGSSQTQVQLGGTGILGSVSSSAGNAQAQISLSESSGSGQAGSSGVGPFKSQVQINLGQYGRGSMASAGVTADDRFDHISDGFAHQDSGGSRRGYDLQPGIPVHPEARNFGGYPGYPGYEHQGPSQTTYGIRDGRDNLNGHLVPGIGRQHPYGISNGASNLVHQTSPPVSTTNNANLPQLPDLGSRSNQMFRPANQRVSEHGTDFENSGSQGRFSPGHGGTGTTNEINYNRPSSQYPWPGNIHPAGNYARTQDAGNFQSTGQYPPRSSISKQNDYVASNSGSGYGGDRGSTAYAGGAGLPHALASGSGQAQAQSQMVYLGQGTTRFYHPQYEESDWSSYPQQHHDTQTSRSPNLGTARGYDSFPTTKSPIIPRPIYSGNNSIFTNYDHNLTRNTIQDGFIPTSGDYAKPYIQNGQYANEQFANNNRASHIIPTTQRPITAPAISHYNGQQTSILPHYQQSSRANGRSQAPAVQTTHGRNGNNGGYSPSITEQTDAIQQTLAPGNELLQGFYPTYWKPAHESNGGGGNGKKCTVVTFTCTILVESNGRAKICRPSQNGIGDHGGGQIDQARAMQICCC